MGSKTIKSRFCKSNIICSIIISAALSLTVFFFSPIDIFVANQIDFVVGYDKIIFPMLGMSLLSIVLLMGIFMLCLLIRETFFNIVKNILFGLLCAMYFQMLFYNGHMKALTGRGNIYLDNQMVYNYINYIVFFIMICLPVTIWGIKENYPDLKPLQKLNKKTAPFICLAIILMQLVGSVSLVFNYRLREVSDEEYAGVMSYDEALILSPDKNIVVFIADRLDSTWMDEELEAFPDVNEILDGFTFYQNNVSNYTNTFPSVARMATGNEYNGKNMTDYLTDAWNTHNMMDIFHENNYRINLLIGSTTSYNSYNDIKDIADTYKRIESDYKIRYFGSRGIIHTMTSFSLMKLGPYFIKGLITERFGPDFANDFFEIDNEKYARFPVAVGFDSDIGFYDYLKNDGLKTKSEKNTFSFIHLYFAHDISSELAAIYPSFDKSTFANKNESIRGGFEILNEYFSQMKELGIYDSSTIIVVGDHGRSPEANEVDSKRLDGSIATTLLIKEANAEHAPLKIDRTSELSNDYFNASILEYAGLDHSEYGYSYNDVINGNLHLKRFIDVFTFDDYLPIHVCQYEITGDARDFDNWKYINID